MSGHLASRAFRMRVSGEWDTGIPIVHKVRDRDEKYWDEYRERPRVLSLSKPVRKCGETGGFSYRFTIDKMNIPRMSLLPVCAKT